MISSLVLGSTKSLLNVGLGSIDPAHLVIVKIAQIVLGLTGLSATVITTLMKQLELNSHATNNSEYASKYCELRRQIRAELVLLKMKDSNCASPREVLKQCTAELNRVEESAPAIPKHVIKRVGAKCTCSPVQSPSRQSEYQPEGV